MKSAARWLRTLAVSVLSGLVLGAGARLVMRFVALEAGLPAGASLGGTLEVVLFGAIVGTPVALVFLACRPCRRVPRPWPGLLCGVLLFGVLALVPPPAARSALADTPDTPAATAVAFGALFVAWGLLLEGLAGRSESVKRSRS